ncbi:unnamed protein product [Urochloa humidicola]
MAKAWQGGRPVPIQRLEDNRYIIEFDSEHVYNFVINGGPWRHKGDALIVVPFDGFCRPSEVVIDAVNVWVRFYDVPDTLRTPQFSAVLARKVSPRVLDSGGPVRNRNFLRARVVLLLEEPLKPVVEASIKGQGVMGFEVGYENVPFFCFVCGRMGHSKRECPKDEDDSEEEEALEMPDGQKKKKFGDWMRKSPLKRSAEKPLALPAPSRANRVLNFSGEQLFKVQAAASGTGGKRKLMGDAGKSGVQPDDARERSLLKLPWGVSKELSDGVQRMSMGASTQSKGSLGAACASGLNSFVDSSAHTGSGTDLLNGKDSGEAPRSIFDKLRAAKAARGLIGEGKRGSTGPSPKKEIGKPKKKKELKVPADGTPLKEHMPVVEEVSSRQGTGTSDAAAGTEKETLHNSGLLQEKLAYSTGTHEEFRREQ